MEKTIKWEPSEAMQIQQLEQERVNTLAQIGALMMDLDTAKKGLEGVNERHKSTIRQILQARGITQYDSGRPIQGGIVLNVPDEAKNGG